MDILLNHVVEHTVVLADQKYLISTDRRLLDIPLIHMFLTHESYWNRGISLEAVTRSILHSLPFGVYAVSDDGGRTQVAFARVVTDFAVFAYLADVFTVESRRGTGIGKLLVGTIVQHPLLRVRRFLLATRDAHGLYRQYGFQPLKEPQRIMEINIPDFFSRQQPRSKL